MNFCFENSKIRNGAANIQRYKHILEIIVLRRRSTLKLHGRSWMFFHNLLRRIKNHILLVFTCMMSTKSTESKIRKDRDTQLEEVNRFIDGNF